MSDKRKSGLTTRDLHALDRAVLALFGGRRHHFAHLSEFLNGTYLVGTAQTGGGFRDVDVRTILADDVFDARFPDGAMWSTFCFLAADWLTRQTGLPVDYQVQRRTEANAKYPGNRNPLGTGRGFAGFGDAAPFDVYGERSASGDDRTPNDSGGVDGGFLLALAVILAVVAVLLAVGGTGAAR